MGVSPAGIRAVAMLWVVLLGCAHASGLTFEHTLVEVQAAADTRSVVADFNFENRSAKPVTIAKYDKTCTCMAVQVSDGKLVYGPGEKGVIRATFDLENLLGTLEKPVKLWIDQDPDDKPSLVLTTRIHIPVLVVIDTKTLKWDLGSKPETRLIDIRMAYAKPIRIVSTQCSSENFKMDLETLEEGKHYVLHVTPATTDAPSLGVIQIKTDCDIARHQSQLAFVAVQRQHPAPAVVQPPASPAAAMLPRFKWLAAMVLASLIVSWLGLRMLLRQKGSSR